MLQTVIVCDLIATKFVIQVNYVYAKKRRMWPILSWDVTGTIPTNLDRTDVNHLVAELYGSLQS